MFTKPISTTRDGERNNDAISLFQGIYVLACLDNDSHWFMTHHVAGLHGGHEAIIQMQDRATDRGRGDFDGDVRWICDHGIGNVINTQVTCAVPANSLHLGSLSIRFPGASGLSLLALAGELVAEAFLARVAGHQPSTRAPAVRSGEPSEERVPG